MTLPSFLTSASFWSTLAGAVSAVIGSLDPGSQLAQPIQTLLIAVGGLLIAIPAHHVIATQQAAKVATTPAPAPPVVPGA